MAVLIGFERFFIKTCYSVPLNISIKALNFFSSTKLTLSPIMYSPTTTPVKRKMNEWYWLTDCLNEQMDKWMNEFINERIKSMNDCLLDWSNEWLSKWMNGWMNDRRKERTNDWMNEQGRERGCKRAGGRGEGGYPKVQPWAP